MRLVAFLLLLMSRPYALSADDDAENWEKWYEAIADQEEADPETLDDVYELLNGMASNPININDTKREELEVFPFLSSQQVMDIMDYLDRYGPMKSKNELSAIESLDFYRRRLLACFIVVGEKKEDKSFNLKNVLRYGKSEFMAYSSIPTYKRKGDVNGYLGYQYKHWLRYGFTYRDKLKFGIVASQDAGEPFFANKNGMGYDYYSPYLVVGDVGPFSKIALGRYKVSVGMGLVVNMGFGLGKMSMLQSFGGKTNNTVCAHSSRSEASYLQGAAATLRLNKSLHLTGFVSCRKVDATLNDDGSVSTLIYSGYHRSEGEMEKKNNTTMSDFGVSMAFDKNDFHLGATALSTHIDRKLSPNTSALYRRFYPQGHDFFTSSIDYSFRRYPFFASGETALDGRGHLATINTLTFCCSPQVSLILLHRFFSLKYNAIHAYAFSEGGRVQNESGLYAGLEWKPRYGSLVSVYLDYAYFPWARYLVSQSSRSFDGFVSSMLKFGSLTLLARYRVHRRQRDTYETVLTKIKPLVWKTEQRARLGLAWDNGFVRTSTQIDASMSECETVSRGIMFSESLGVTFGKLTVNGSFKYYITDDYDSRVYSYESGPLYSFSMPSFYGRGIRYSLYIRWKPVDALTLYAKVGVTDYFDRDVIGSGLQQIDASSACNLELQLRWCF